MKIVIGTDHRGFALKEWLKQQVMTAHEPISWIDIGCFTAERCDYPPFAIEACQYILQKRASHAVLLCGTGVGMAIAANRFAGIYAGLVWNEEVARKSKEDDNCNVLALPADYLNEEQMRACIQAWISATFKGGRYQTRIDMIDKILRY